MVVLLAREKERKREQLLFFFFVSRVVVVRLCVLCDAQRDFGKGPPVFKFVSLRIWSNVYSSSSLDIPLSFDDRREECTTRRREREKKDLLPTRENEDFGVWSKKRDALLSARR